ncbi:hypothetical protein Hanom_Chr09g00799681 [Helianthus anomalus]
MNTNKNSCSITVHQQFMSTFIFFTNQQPVFIRPNYFFLFPYISHSNLNKGIIMSLFCLLM